MSGMDPSDPDFRYLGVDKKKALAEAPPYDGKKNCWIPDEKEGYLAVEIESTKGDMVTVKTPDNLTKEVKKDDIQQMNPPKFYMYDDMANLTYLNEAAILYNLRTRYVKLLIYTYSGLFCIAINPYKRLPIYTMQVVKKYRGKRKGEMPPHLFAIADNAYANMVQDRENQSMLITGESGAGKTENTKKVIGYFAMVAAMQQEASKDKEEDDKDKKQASLEEQIVQTNPPLEAFGNAKTVRNNNSSRFGKFIRIHFAPNGKIAGADIESYLLEKSRVTYQMPGVERNYHIFYWLLTGAYPDYCQKLLVDPNPSQYFFINQGCLLVDGIDDPEEMKVTDEAFDSLGFTFEEKFSLYKVSCAVLNFGEMKFKQRPREEQAEADGTAQAEKASFLLGVNSQDLLKAMLMPKVKVGTEMVTKGQNLDQVNFAVQALSKCLYAKAFTWLVLRVNKTLDTKAKRQYYIGVLDIAGFEIFEVMFAVHALSKCLYHKGFNWLIYRVNKTLDTKAKRQYYIGVLDIAGFEIFEFNTFEQLCINYTNERLQQFFNHHMFVLEQEEYKKEGIVWAFIDFGMDLAATIELIEKPMGILSILEEECMFPKADDKSFIGKLYDNHLGKSNSFGKPKPDKKAKYEKHFELYHYAGTVGYNIAGWLNKNKDPINDTVVECLRASKENLVKHLFAESEDAKGGGGGKKKKGAGMQTISATHRESLNKLMKNLYTTHPHFVRCIIPNEVKESGQIDAGLVLHQLRCNGVLEGIRICRKGFPNRMQYAEFKQRYIILAASAVPDGTTDAKVMTDKVLGALPMEEDSFRLGNTKVFFKAGVLGQLEDWRDERLGKIMTMFQSLIRGAILRESYQRLLDQRVALELIQRNIRNWQSNKNWAWYKLLVRIKPLIAMARSEEEMKEKLAQFDKINDTLEKTTNLIVQVKEQHGHLQKEKEELDAKLSEELDKLNDYEEKIVDFMEKKAEYEDTLKDYEERIACEAGGADRVEMEKKKADEKVKKMKGDIENMESNIHKVENERKTKDAQIKTLNDEMARNDESIAKANKDKKAMEESLVKAQEGLQAEEDKANHLAKLKHKLETSIEDMGDHLESEKRNRAEVDKAKRKMESDLKLCQENVEELDRIKHDLEENLKRKDNEMNQLNRRLEDESSTVAQLEKKIKDLQARIAELEEELEAERQARSKVEKQRMSLQSELDELAERLDEAGGATQAQADLNKKREAELQRMKRDLEEQAIQSEAAMASMKKRSNEAVNELNDQLDQLSKARSKIEKERNSLKGELEDLSAQLDVAMRGKSAAEKVSKSLEGQLQELNIKLDDCSRSCQELSSGKSRMEAENADLSRQLREVEQQVSQLGKQRTSLQKQLDEIRSAADEETRVRAKLQADNKSIQSDVDRLRDQLEEETEARADLQRLLQKAQQEATLWKRKCESGEGGVRAEEVDDIKRKLAARLADAESQLEGQLGKVSSMEKQKARLQGELEDLTIETERSRSIADSAEKQQRSFDKTIDEWKHKVADVQAELERANADGRASAAEVYRIRSQIDETHETIEALRRENKNLSGEIHDITDQLSDGGRSVHELEKARKRLEMEKEELQSALEEAEAALEAEEAKVQRSQLEISAIRQEMDRRIRDKDDEFDSTRKNFQRALDSMQASLEAEARGKAEAMRMKKKLESDLNELEAALDGASRGRNDAEKNIKRFQQNLRDIQHSIEEAQRSRDDAREQYTQSERRATVLAGEIEELRTQLESAERARKAADSELHEASDRVSELSAHNSSLLSAKRKLEADAHAMQTDLEDQSNELRLTEDGAKKAMADASRLAEELRSHQDHAAQIEKVRRTLESQVKELQSRLDEAEASAMKGGKRMIQKLEQRVRELEVELDGEQRRHGESAKGTRKQEKRLRELAAQADEDRKAQERMQDMVDKLQQKIKTYKTQVESAEEIAAVNLAKYRKVQHELEESEERADMAENTLSKLRAKNRSSMSASRH